MVSTIPGSGSLLLAADLGKTGCRLAVERGGHVQARGQSPGAVGLAAADGVEQVVGAVAAAARAAGVESGAEVGTLSVGLVGYHAAGDRLPELAARFASLWPGADAVFSGDVTTSHAGALGGRAGTVMAAGTGAVALAVADDGRFAVRDGWGFLLGDDGSGYAIGRAGLRAALLHREGRGGSPALADAAVERFGALEGLPALVHSDPHPARWIAGFARVVADAARDGDAVARRIWSEAAERLAGTALSAALAVTGDQPGPVCLGGGLADVGDLLRTPFEAAVAREWPAHGLPVPELTHPQADSLAGAQLLGREVLERFAGLLTRFAAIRPARSEGSSALGGLATERVAPGLEDLDQRPTAEIVRTLWRAEGEVVPALLPQAAALAAAVDAIVPRFRAGGRVIYVGAGTPGRLAFVDASEIPPTYGTDPSRVVALIAGGEQAFRRAAEGAEDDEEQAVADLAALGVGPQDTVIGVAASGRTPYVVAAVRHARSVGALTVAVANNPGSALAGDAEHVIEALTGPEVITGSTRLKAGTAQKLVLNALSTTLMVRLGKTLGSLMVDMVASNGKLQDRAVRMTCAVTGAPEEEARAALTEAGWSTTLAIVMLRAGVDAPAAEALVRDAGSVRAALERSAER